MNLLHRYFRSKPRWRRLFSAIAIITMASNCHLTTLAIQSIGWTYMFTRYVQDGQAEDAFEKTFSGDNPCGFCNAAEALAETVDPSSEDEMQPAPVSANQHLLLAVTDEALPSFGYSWPGSGRMRHAHDLRPRSVEPLPG